MDGNQLVGFRNNKDSIAVYSFDEVYVLIHGQIGARFSQDLLVHLFLHHEVDQSTQISKLRLDQVVEESVEILVWAVQHQPHHSELDSPFLHIWKLLFYLPNNIAVVLFQPPVVLCLSQPPAPIREHAICS